MFAVSYIWRDKNEDGDKLQNIESNPLAAILVGRSTICNSPVFFHSHSKKLITTDDFYINETIPTSPAFDIAYVGDLNMSFYEELNIYLKPPTFRP